MCRNIKTLFNFEPPATDEEIRAASLQFVRKLSGFNSPSRANSAAFDRAVEQVAASARVLPQPGQYRRTHLLSLIESVRGKAIGSGVISEAELDRHCAELRGHLTDPATVVIDKLLIQSWGRKPA